MRLDQIALGACGGALVAVLAGLALGYAPPPPAAPVEPIERAPVADPREAEGVALSDARAAVAAALSDPESARFKGLVATGDSICGLVNAKNRFGGYVGFRPFLYDPSTGKALIFDPPRGDNAPLFELAKLAFHNGGCEQALGAPLESFF